MDTYINKLAPWERKNSYYKNIQLGKDVESKKKVLRDQTLEMIISQIASTGGVIATKKIPEGSIFDIAYDMKSVEGGMYGLKAAFEWGISDVVWQIELNKKHLREYTEALYKPFNRQVKEIWNEAKTAYGDGRLDEALEKFLELEKEIVFDYSAHITIGLVYLFHKINKEKALGYFDKALNHARSNSHYYTSYALLYKALIKRDYGLIGEAESCSKKAMEACSNLTEAIYQNAQYNALLNKPDIAIPLLKKVIKSDIIYCLKIKREKDFEGIRTHVNRLFDEIREEQNKQARDVFKELQDQELLLNNTAKKIRELGFDLSKTFLVETLQSDKSEVAEIIGSNTIVNSYIANRILLQIGKRLQQKKFALKETCKEVKNELENKIDQLGSQLVKEKNGSLSRFFLYLFFGQLVAVPAGVSFGIPIGICVAEAVLFALCLYLNLVSFRTTWKEVIGIEDKKEKLDWIMRGIKT
ncbi:MAG: hypothetical protein MRK02_05905 [Candidatus Scalindua sp.]|nr:hypothetical protein [Candidatus Scalindua sp.]